MKASWRMAVKLTTVRNVLWFWTIVFLVLSFPLQVYINSPYPAIWPYPLIGLIIIVTLFYPLDGISRRIHSVLICKSKNINSMVNIYLFLLLFNTAWQILYKVIGFYEGVSALVIYLLPIFFYFYFRNLASDQEIRRILKTMVVVGLIVGIYFVYDSYSKMALGQVTDYAYKAFQYSLDRVQITQNEANIARISINARSSGLLQTHSVSGAWIVLATLASLALIRENRKILRCIVILIFGLLLFLSLNFTAIISFSIIMFLFEFGGLSMLRDRVLAILRNLISLTLIGGFLMWLGNMIAGDSMSKTIYRLFTWQRDFLFGTGGVDNESKLSMIFGTLGRYSEHISNYPLTLVFGDGFSSFGMEKGGDIGFIDTMAKLGLVFFLVCIFSLLSLIKSRLRQIESLRGTEAGRNVRFAISVLMLALLAEVHYSIWTAKSVLPMIFFALALCERYLPVSESNAR